RDGPLKIPLRGFPLLVSHGRNAAFVSLLGFLRRIESGDGNRGALVLPYPLEGDHGVLVQGHVGWPVARQPDPYRAGVPGLPIETRLAMAVGIGLAANGVFHRAVAEYLQAAIAGHVRAAARPGREAGAQTLAIEHGNHLRS